MVGIYVLQQTESVLMDRLYLLICVRKTQSMKQKKLYCFVWKEINSSRLDSLKLKFSTTT